MNAWGAEIMGRDHWCESTVKSAISNHGGSPSPIFKIIFPRLGPWSTGWWLPNFKEVRGKRKPYARIPATGSLLIRLLPAGNQGNPVWRNTDCDGMLIHDHATSSRFLRLVSRPRVHYGQISQGMIPRWIPYCSTSDNGIFVVDGYL